MSKIKVACFFLGHGVDTVGSCILFYCRDKLLVIHVLLPFSSFMNLTGFMNLTLRPTSRLADGVGSHALGDLTGDPHSATLRDMSPEVATSLRQLAPNVGPSCIVVDW